MKLVRLYGSQVGYGSARTVTEGWKQALEAHGLLADVWLRDERSLRNFGATAGDRSTVSILTDLRDAPVAVVTDLRELMPALANDHKEVHVVVALHSDWAPPDLLSLLADKRVTVLAPSEDTQQHFLGMAVEHSIRVMVVPHGVDAGFEPLTDEKRKELEGAKLYKQLRHPDPSVLNWLHMCESSCERKGTYVLIRAMEIHQLINPHAPAVLTIVPSAMEHSKLKMFISQTKTPECFRVLPRLNAPPEKLKWVYASFDAIVQPSRAEGFGLVPLEGLVMGIPCAITLRCGHAQWAETSEDTTEGGIQPIWAKAPGPPLFEPAPAPVVDEQDLSVSLRNLATYHEPFKQNARINAKYMREKWTWPRVTANWAREIKERYA